MRIKSARFADSNPGDYMYRLLKSVVFFIIGGIGYGIIEIIWRGYTHWAMLIAGGLCFITFSFVAENYTDCSRCRKAILCALCITEVELVFGIIFNIILKQNIWDYGNIRFNILGQICPLYTILWGGLSFILLPFAEWLNRVVIINYGENMQK